MNFFKEFPKTITAKIFLICIIVFSLQVTIPVFNEIFVLRSDRLYRIDTWITNMFMHGSLLHLLGNMVGVVTIGFVIEKIMGNTKSYIKLYIITGICASLLQISFDLIFFGMKDIGYVGASGALCGLVGALAYYIPNARLLVFFILPMRTILLFFLLILASFVLYFTNVIEGGQQVAHLAHAGGLISGFILARYLAPKLELKVEGMDFQGQEWSGIVRNIDGFQEFIKKCPFNFKWEYVEGSRKLNAKEDYTVSMMTYAVHDLVSDFIKKREEEEDESE
jgi:membrane associated rhomboid family serine protease